MSSTNAVKHSQPIPIDTAHHRRRSPSCTPSEASDSSASPASPLPLRTPPTLPLPLNPRVATNSAQNVSSSTSPILSYFLSQSPTKNPASATFPFRARGPGVGSAVAQDDEDADRNATPTPGHHRRASSAYAGRFPPQPSTFVPPSTQPPSVDTRGAGFLRRLSLSSAFARPSIPSESPITPNSALAPPPPTPSSANAVSPSSFASEPAKSTDRSPRRKPRSHTVNAGIRRAPSPMGERILKGHFDGFN